MDIFLQGRWYEKLGEWEKALEMYKIEILEKKVGSPSSTSQARVGDNEDLRTGTYIQGMLKYIIGMLQGIP